MHLLLTIGLVAVSISAVYSSYECYSCSFSAASGATDECSDNSLTFDTITCEDACFIGNQNDGSYIAFIRACGVTNSTIGYSCDDPGCSSSTGDDGNTFDTCTDCCYSDLCNGSNNLTMNSILVAAALVTVYWM